MRRTLFFSAALLAAALFAAGCGPAMQKIPVSTNPSGATVLANGEEKCLTPCTIALPKTQAHILTITKEGYEQVDIAINRRYKAAEAMRKAVEKGIETVKSDGDVTEVLDELSREEESGEAYELVPETVIIQLRSLSAPSDKSGTL